MKRLTLLVTTIFGALPALAQEGAPQAAHAASAAGIGNPGLFALGAGIIVGLAAIGGTLGQGKVGAAAMDGIARNPQAQKAMFTPMIVVLAFIESLFIVSWALAFLFQMKF